MKFKEIEDITVRILQNANGKFLFPYQIFNKIQRLDSSLSQQIMAAYPTKPGNPHMGEGAGIYYSAASFISKALNEFRDHYPQIGKAWVDSRDIKIEGIVAGAKGSVSIWAWEKAK